MADAHVFVAFALRAANAPGDACLVHRRDSSGAVRLVACHHRRGEATALLSAWLTGRGGEGSPRAPWVRVLHGGGTQFTPVAGDADVRDLAEAPGDLYLARWGVQSILAMPVSVNDTVVGAVTVLRDRLGEPYSDADRQALRRLIDGLARVLARQEAAFPTDTTPGAFPLADAHAAARARLRKSPAGAAPTIMLVEDEDSVRELVREILQRQGYTVLEAETAEQALAVIASHTGRLDLLLTDVVMPGMSGVALADRLRETHPGLGALYMSGYVDQSLTDFGDPARATRFLQKPFTLEALLRSVRAALEGEPGT
ncbi:MAG: response regulator [Acidobacteriota bacterium]|nr:response regulator [Acidobacteriota bacterium]